MSPGAAEPIDSRCLDHVQIISCMTPELRDGLWNEGTHQQFDAGTSLIQAGDISDFVLAILSGEVDVIKPGAGGGKTIRLSAPLLTGEIAAFAGKPRTATVNAATRVQALRIERPVFMNAVRHSAQAGQALTELVASRICAPDSMTRIGDYVIESLAGKGGSGCVFKAKHEPTGKSVALKMLSHALALIPGAADDFFREASLLASLRHPGIIQVLEAFPAYDTCFIAMPWIEGISLRKRIDAQQAIGATDLYQWTLCILEAIHVLEQSGIVHGDISPSNILISSSGDAMVIDLGAGCFRGSGQHAANNFRGSPLYASPEQIMGRALDNRSDIYNFCCTMYEAVFGVPPFPGDTIEAVLDGHLRGTPAFDSERRKINVHAPYLDWLHSGLTRARNRRITPGQSLEILRGKNT